MHNLHFFSIFNGNITAITRHNNSASGTAKTFSYSGNRRVSNSYDANGNVTYDSESGVIASYNLINLPASLISSDYNIYYDYLADGTKLRTQQEEFWTGYTYAGPFRYNDNDGSLSLESVAFGEGRFVRTGTGARNFATRYFIKDHLGSVRVVADDNGTALERDDYLPYGERANDPALTRNGNNFLYGGKELQDRDDIDWYDSGARFQTTSGIFTSIDPEAEKYYPISPYAYCGGNPVNHIDPNGMTDWKLLRKGVETIISGAGTALVGIGLTGLTDGTAAPAGGVLLIVEGVSSVGIGAAMSIDGVVSNPSEQTKEVAENLPTSPSNALAKSADKVVGNKNHEVERTVDAAWTAVGIATLKMPTNFKEHIEFFGTMVQVKSTMSNVNQNSQQNKKSTSNNPDKSQNNNKKVKSYDTKKDNH
jgi:RHS repeat-associated protein